MPLRVVGTATRRGADVLAAQVDNLMVRGSRFPIDLVGDIYRYKWTVLGAAALGFAVFQVLGLGLEFVASAIDGAVYTNVTSSVREVLVRYRAWELYRALLYSMSAAFCGWTVARVFRSHQMMAITSVVLVIGASLLISLFTGPGYYLRDFALIGGISLSPLIGGMRLRQCRRTQGC